MFGLLNYRCCCDGDCRLLNNALPLVRRLAKEMPKKLVHVEQKSRFGDVSVEVSFGMLPKARINGLARGKKNNCAKGKIVQEGMKEQKVLRFVQNMQRVE